MNKRNTILIVDDIPQNIQLAAQHLKSLNLKLLYATSGKKALQLLTKNGVDLILLDVMMPELNGYDCCRQIRTNPQWRDIPVIFLTARNEVNDIIKGFEAGGSDYITKPFYGQELVARVRTHLDLKNHRDLLERREVQLKELLHILSHDLRNSLSGITMTMDLAEIEKAELERYRGRLRDLSTNGLDILDLVRTMLLLEEKPLQLNPVLLNDCIHHCLHLLSTKIKEKKINIVLDLKNDYRVMAEETSLINSVVMNILTNALKFSYSGGTVRINLKENKDKIELIVMDEGTGIPDTLLPHLFDVRKGHSLRGTEGEKGSGFGLPLVKKFMTAYGAELQVESSEAGTAIHLLFPAIDPLQGSE
ncbi:MULTISPECIES: hybrid sensor histidine kinase/response regulator [unclassified Oceanispirochaeta]|uniref:hybrid sensor histidine kinase/response regulator n=1 Tax=unclassified Oceanispirochaeta TaxID=2635722 RepID=UPI001314287F|nr:MULTISPECIES: hybrid sensor histidine kinase/response regulator [unclassified Oceanispirochaeta]MBF9015673.1 hybrid sensor histidine kinase/response regulator [Oceanispirochaeta sp. M2]NPD73447.1 hybrid sensor histidine kinase/response regulator [Oceanispirochaeta sp. M1]